MPPGLLRYDSTAPKTPASAQLPGRLQHDTPAHRLKKRPKRNDYPSTFYKANEKQKKGKRASYSETLLARLLCNA
jgi:hypothetical protein